MTRHHAQYLALSLKKIKKNLIKDYVECFELVALCNFQAELKLLKVREISISTPGQNCTLPSHQLGKCVLDWRMVREGCPDLQIFGGVGVKEFKEIRANRKKEKEYTRKAQACVRTKTI